MSFSLFLFACANNQPIRASGPGSIYAQVEELDRMKYIEVTDMRAVRKNGLLNVQSEITNLDDDTQQIHYRYKWLDGGGFTVGNEEAWKPALIYGQQRKMITGIAPSGAVTDFRLVLQSPDRGVN